MFILLERLFQQLNNYIKNSISLGLTGAGGSVKPVMVLEVYSKLSLITQDIAAEAAPPPLTLKSRFLNHITPCTHDYIWSIINYSSYFNYRPITVMC